jgi:VIT1/CCC1 family predicted Fe2+/Mn2+ transporter
VGGLALALIALWLVLVGGVRGYLQYRRTGTMAIRARDRTGSPQWWARVLATIGLLAGIVAAIADIAGFAALEPLQQTVVAAVALALVAVGIVATMASQLAMGDSWRATSTRTPGHRS